MPDYKTESMIEKHHLQAVALQEIRILLDDDLRGYTSLDRHNDSDPTALKTTDLPF